MAYNDRHPKPPTPIKPRTPTPPKEPTPPGNLHDNMEKQSIPFEHNMLRMLRLYSFNGFSLYWIRICTDRVQLIWKKNCCHLFHTKKFAIWYKKNPTNKCNPSVKIQFKSSIHRPCDVYDCIIVF